MRSIKLLPETVAQADGIGPTADLGSAAGKLLVLTLEITRSVEQESLEVEVWGSTDGTTWGDKPIAVLPQKYYCGMYSMLINLSRRPEIRFLRLAWKMKRWARADNRPLFAFSAFVEESGARLVPTSVTSTSTRTAAVAAA
jgi:hypothetical protein